MKVSLQFKPFHQLVNNEATDTARKKFEDSVIIDMDIKDDKIVALVKDTKMYRVNVDYNESAVLHVACNCINTKWGYCKHIVHVLVKADGPVMTKIQEREALAQLLAPDLLTKTNDTFFIKQPAVIGLSSALIKELAEENWGTTGTWHTNLSVTKADIIPDNLQATIKLSGYTQQINRITIQQQQALIALGCDCHGQGSRLCEHLTAILSEIQTNKELQLAFNEEARLDYLSAQGSDYGWTRYNIDLDDVFKITYSGGKLHAGLKISLLSLTHSSHQKLKTSLLHPFELPKNSPDNRLEFILVKQKFVADRLDFLLMTAPLSTAEEIKTPLTPINIFERLQYTQEREELLFYTALTTLAANPDTAESYRNILQNPFDLPFYFYNGESSSKTVNPEELQPISISSYSPSLEIHVKESGDFQVLTCQIKLDNKKQAIESLQVYNGIIHAKGKLHLLNNEAEAKVLDFFGQHKNKIYIHKSQFPIFKSDFLDHLENSVSINYSFISPAPATLIKEQGLHTLSKPTLLLSDKENHVLITPTIFYGDIEVPVLSKRTVFTHGPDGTIYTLDRDEAVEQQLIRTIQAEHPAFDNIPSTEFFHLHKKEFLETGWFINAFEAWREKGYTIHGFNQLKNNRYNPHRMRIKTNVQSGIDWFDIHTDISFGEQKVGLRQLQKSILNKSRFVELTDGTQGILPKEWLEKFGRYFRNGHINGESIRTHKTNFQVIDDLFAEEVLSQEIQEELHLYKEKLANFQSISSVKVPKKLKATLRDYQKEGLNWLNFLDEFGFGGCLADDMGLGKTVQIIAYFLAQHEKGNKTTNLVIVPTSLLFNWQKELEKFAPHLRYHVLHGLNRKPSKLCLEHYDIIITTYGVLLWDIQWLKNQLFNVIVLDESQAIKNPTSQRYKAVRLLQARQRLVMTGTPVENNTFDLYAQLSFAVPGLLGSAQRFAIDYSTPIDKLQDSNRAQELQRKIHPFVLRRTKKQVARELPEKTEMIVYCEMGTEQRRVYDSYKLAFQNYLSGLEESELHSSSLHILQGLTKLRQICNSPSLLPDDEYYGHDSAKLEELMEQVCALKDAHKILVFSQFVGMLEMIKDRLDQENIGYAYLTGKTKDRQKQVESFQEDDDIRVFLISLKAGGTGLNLTQAEYVFLIDPWWNPAVENQAIDRAYRIGQENKVVAIRLVTPDSIEEKILELQKRKRQLADDLIHTDSNMLKQLSRNDLIDLL